MAGLMVAGGLSHTMSVPTCLLSSSVDKRISAANLAADARVPMFADLDAAIQRAGAAGSAVDVVGARYFRAGTTGGHPPWRTTVSSTARLDLP